MLCKNTWYLEVRTAFLPKKQEGKLTNKQSQGKRAILETTSDELSCRAFCVKIVLLITVHSLGKWSSVVLFQLSPHIYSMTL
jgi:hypothetical protein